MSREPSGPYVRVLRILYVIFCFEIGIFLLIFPWTPYWIKNFFVGHYPWISSLVRNYFFRGAISGVGVADVILGFWETWRLRRELGLVQSTFSR